MVPLLQQGPYRDTPCRSGDCLCSPNQQSTDQREGIHFEPVALRVRPRSGENDSTISEPQTQTHSCVASIVDRAGLAGEVLARRARRLPSSRSAFAGFRFPAEVIVVAVRWYLRYGLSYRDVEELLAERGIEVDHVTVYRWVQRFTPLLADAARFARHSPGDRWFVDETYVKVNGVWRYVYRAVDQHGQVIDVLVSKRRDGEAARRFFHTGADHVEGDTDRGGHRRGAGLSAGPRRAGAGGVASRRAVREQPDRGRPRPAQTPAATDARATHRPHRRRSSSPGSRSCRTSAAATTNSPPKPHATLRVAAAFTELAQAI